MPQKIVFLGTNGSGKTSTINFIKNKLEQNGKTTEIYIMGWKDFKNPILKLFSKIYLKSSFKKEEKDRLDRFKERSVFFYLIYYLELLTRYSEIKRLNSDFILIDRYFYEELMFTKGWKYKLFRKLTPIPDKAFVLEINSKKLASRGHNVSEENLKNFYLKLKNLSKDFTMHFIEVSDKSYEEIYKEIINKLKINER